MVKELVLAFAVVVDSVIIPISLIFRLESLEKQGYLHVPTFFNPLLEVVYGRPKLLGGCPPFYLRLALVVAFPSKLESKKYKPFIIGQTEPAEPKDSRLFRRNFQAELSKAVAELSVKPVGVLLVLKGTYKVISISDDHSHSPAISLDPLFKPEVQCIVQIDVSQDWRYNSSLQSTRYRVDHLAVRFKDSRLQPLVDES